MGYRSDINGLRAIAVFSVVLFHFNEGLAPGGFAGVDIFLVISGYLMTSIIFGGLHENRFSIVEFYLRRANRILPALSVLCFFLLLFGWLALAPLEYETVGKHVFSSVSFLSNVIYHREAGYFDLESKGKWLLHTWSLSVEWQFYVIYPIICAIVARLLGFRALKILCLSLLLVGFFYCIYRVGEKPGWAYYSLLARSWELLAGAAVFLVSLKVPSFGVRIAMFTAGLLIIICSFIFVDSSYPWPSAYSIPSVGGTCLILLANLQKNPLFTNDFVSCLGRWSYSIYLWHWPVVVYSHLNGLQAWWLVGVLLSVFLGFVSYKLIESRNFYLKHSVTGIFRSPVIYFAAIVTIAGYYIYDSGGVINRYPDESIARWKKVSSEISMPHIGNGYCFYSFNDFDGLKVSDGVPPSCFLGSSESESVTALAFGDSYLGQYDPFLEKLFLELDTRLKSISTNWCFPSLEEDFTGPKNHKSYEQCLINREYLKSVIELRSIDKLILAGSWDAVDRAGYIDQVVRLASAASRAGISVIIMPSPQAYTSQVMARYQKYILTGSDLVFNVKDLEQNEERSGDVIIINELDHLRNVTYLSKLEIFNKSGVFKKDGVWMPYTLDGGHISLVGSESAFSKFENSDSYEKILRVLSSGVDP